MTRLPTYRQSLALLLSLGLLGSIGALCYSKSLSLGAIFPGLPEVKAEESTGFTEPLAAIFDHPLTYLGEGNQAYAFLSRDGKHVVKFFKSAPLLADSWLDLLPQLRVLQKWKAARQARAEKKFYRLFNAYQIAYEFDREHCGLLWLQLACCQANEAKATVIDWLGFQHVIDLHSVAFAIQKRATPLNKVLTHHLQAGNTQTACLVLKQVIEMYLDEYQHGILDNDHNLMHNVGMAGQSPMRIDVGKLVKDISYKDPAVYRSDLKKVIDQRIAKWLRQHAPAHQEQILSELGAYIP